MRERDMYVQDLLPRRRSRAPAYLGGGRGGRLQGYNIEIVTTSLDGWKSELYFNIVYEHEYEFCPA